MGNNAGCGRGCCSWFRLSLATRTLGANGGVRVRAGGKVNESDLAATQNMLRTALSFMKEAQRATCRRGCANVLAVHHAPVAPDDGMPAAPLALANHPTALWWGAPQRPFRGLPKALTRARDAPPKALTCACVCPLPLPRPLLHPLRVWDDAARV